MKTENKLFPGRANYSGPMAGYFHAVHHAVLFEKSHDIAERIAYIKTAKSKSEVQTRLRNLLFLPFMTDTLYADYKAKRAPLDADYEAKRASLYAEILAFVRLHNSDSAWNAQRGELDFTE